MKKSNLILMIILFLGLNSIKGQELTKTDEIYKHGSGEYINAIKQIKDGEEVNLSIHFFGRNHDYTYIDDLLTFYSGEPKGFAIFLNELINSFKYDKGISLQVKGINVSIDIIFGKKVLNLTGKKGRGYRLFNEKKLNKILKKYTEWCGKNNIEL